MNKILKLTTCLFTSFFLVSCSITESINDNMSTYEDAEKETTKDYTINGYTLAIPENWTLYEQEEGKISFLDNAQGISFYIDSLDGLTREEFIDNYKLNIQSYDTTKNFSEHTITISEDTVHEFRYVDTEYDDDVYMYIRTYFFDDSFFVSVIACDTEEKVNDYVEYLNPIFESIKKL